MPKTKRKSTAPVTGFRADVKRLLQSHGPQWFDVLRQDPLRLRSIGMTEADISPKLIREVQAELDAEKHAIFDGWAKDNADPDRKLNTIVHGHPVLDPDLNAEHPVRGDAWLEQQVKNDKKRRTDERISKLRARKSTVSAYNENPVSPDPISSNEECPMSATATKTVKIDEAAARNLLTACGVESSDPKAVPAKKVLGRLKSLPEMSKEPDFKAPEDAAAAKLLKKVLAAAEEGVEMELGSPSSNGHAKASKNGHHAEKNGKAEPKAKADKKTNPKKPAADARKQEVKAGTVITREYKGKEHKVTATADGFEYKGKTYPSLTKLAKVITGAPSISGPLFFGLRK